MKFYLAPMEGITGYIYRNAHATYFKGVDKYFTPFISTTQHGKLTSRELNDILPEHNEGINVVPQILSNNAADFMITIHQLEAFGYKEVNLNLGCPSGTVVSKGKGSGFLAYPEALDRFLDDVFKQTSIKISIKTRIGKESPEEFIRLIPIFNRYPLEELIIHPRVQMDYYRNMPRLEVFRIGMELSENPVGYNGDLFTVKHYSDFVQTFPKIEIMMLGRGIIANPGLIEEIKMKRAIDKIVFKHFHDKLYIDYQGVLSGERNVLFKMKESWFYMHHLFSNGDRYAKKIRKTQKLKDYEAVISRLFEEEEIISGAGLFCNSTVSR